MLGPENPLKSKDFTSPGGRGDYASDKLYQINPYEINTLESNCDKNFESLMTQNSYKVRTFKSLQGQNF